MAVSLATPQDVALLKSIEAHTGATMGELEVDDARVAEILVQVNTARRESDIKSTENVTEPNYSSCARFLPFPKMIQKAP